MTDPILPLPHARFRQWDTDGVEGLSVKELEQMPPNEAAIVLDQVGWQEKSRAVPLEVGLQVFRQLTDATQVTVFGRMLPWSQDAYFSKIVEQQPMWASNILLSQYQQELTKKESGSHYIGSEYDSCYFLIYHLAPNQQEILFRTLDQRDPKFAASLKQHITLRNDQAAAAQRRREQPRQVPPTHDTAIAAFIEHLKTRPMPKVFAFGESHGADLPDVLCTGEHFAAEFMPELVKRGVYDFVLEYLPSDIQAAEIEHYLTTGTTDPVATPMLTRLLSGKSLRGSGTTALFAILDQARQLHQSGHPIKIHGGYIPERFRGAFGLLSFDDEVALITVSLATQTAAILKQGKSVAVYMGGIHNDVDTSANKMESIFPLLQEWGVSKDDYLETDLVVPEHIPPGTKFEPYSLYVPSQGVVKVATPAGKLAIIYAGKGPKLDLSTLGYQHFSIPLPQLDRSPDLSEWPVPIIWDHSPSPIQLDSIPDVQLPRPKLLEE